MSNYSELVTILKELLFNRFYPKPEYIRGLLGDGRGNVLVPGRPDYNYARFNRTATETFEVFNKEVSQPVDGTPVLMGEYPWQQNLFQVVSIDWAAYIQTGWGDVYASIQAHNSTHEWPNFLPGSDAINVYLRAIAPMRTQAAGSGSTSVMVSSYEYDGSTGTNYSWPGTPPLSLATATPPSGSMRYMGVYLNPATNTLGVVTGSTTIYTDALEPDRPAWPRGVYPSAYVRLYGGQAAITERDIRDARRLWETSFGGGGWPFEHIVPVTTEAGLIAAIAAADANTIIMLDSDITLTSTLVINKPVTLASLSGESTVTLDHPVADGAAAIVITDTDDEFVTFVNVTISAFEWNVISAVNSSLRFIDCTLIIDGSPSVEQVYCVQIERNTSGSGICRLKATDTQFLSADVGADYGWGILAVKDAAVGSAALQVEIESGRFWLPSGDIEVDDAELYLFNPVLRSVPTLTDAATMTGSWLDGAGVRWPGVTELYAEDGDGPASSPAWAVDTGGNLEGVSGVDVYPDGDVFGLWSRLINYGFTPDEHWSQNVDELAWTGWASYTGFVTPDTISSAANSIYRIVHSTGAVKAFRYRAAATGGQIYLRTRCSITQVAVAGVMIDDGVDDGDSEGATNFIRAYISQASAGAAIQIISQYRTGGGAVTTSTYTPEIPPAVFVGVGLNTAGTLWTNWNGQPFLFGESGERLILATLPAMSWTPARVGIYFASSAAAGGRRGLYDWYDEATS